MYHDMGTNILRISYVTFARGECDSLAKNQSRTIADDLLSKYVMEHGRETGNGARRFILIITYQTEECTYSK